MCWEPRDGQDMLPAFRGGSHRKNCFGLTWAIQSILSVTDIYLLYRRLDWVTCLPLILHGCKRCPNNSILNKWLVSVFGFNGLRKRLRSCERDLPKVSKQWLQNWICKPSLLMLISPGLLFTVIFLYLSHLSRLCPISLLPFSLHPPSLPHLHQHHHIIFSYLRGS